MPLDPIFGTELAPEQFMFAHPNEDVLKLSAQGFEADIHNNGWDARPTFCLLIKTTEAFGVIEMEMPPSWYDAPDVTTGMFIKFLNERPEHRAPVAAALPEGFDGLLVAFEGWCVPPQGEPGTPEHERWHQMAREGRLHEHEERKEERIVWACQTDGRELAVRRVRGEFPVTFDPNTDDPNGNVILMRGFRENLSTLVRMFDGYVKGRS